MEQSSEKPIILAVTTLFLSLLLVYLAFFRVQDGTKEADVAVSDGEVLLSGENTASESESIDELLSGSSTTSGVSNNNLGDWVDLSSSSSAVSTSASTTSGDIDALIDSTNTEDTDDIKNRIKTLTGVAPYYNSLKVADILALSVKSAFSDSSGVQYGYLGTGTIDSITATLKRLGGNAVAIETENNIKKNLLRGDRVVFVNIPGVTFVRKGATEQKLLVAMIMEIGDDKRLVQSSLERYYDSKKRMKTIFEQIYKKFL